MNVQELVAKITPGTWMENYVYCVEEIDSDFETNEIVGVFSSERGVEEFLKSKPNIKILKACESFDPTIYGVHSQKGLKYTVSKWKVEGNF